MGYSVSCQAPTRVAVGSLLLVLASSPVLFPRSTATKWQGTGGAPRSRSLPQRPRRQQAVTGQSLANQLRAAFDNPASTSTSNAPPTTKAPATTPTTVTPAPVAPAPVTPTPAVPTPAAPASTASGALGSGSAPSSADQNQPGPQPDAPGGCEKKS